jgi:predicted PhzF superfamily epimerase YddE/YHI9
VLHAWPTSLDADVGLVGPCPPDGDAAVEVRAFSAIDGLANEDPVTGSLNAGVAQWLLGAGVATARYVARQRTVLGRLGRVHVDVDADGAVWVGGATTSTVSGTVDL